MKKAIDALQSRSGKAALMMLLLPFLLCPALYWLVFRAKPISPAQFEPDHILAHARVFYVITMVAVSAPLFLIAAIILARKATNRIAVRWLAPPVVTYALIVLLIGIGRICYRTWPPLIENAPRSSAQAAASFIA